MEQKTMFDHRRFDRLFLVGVGSSVFLHLAAVFYMYASANASQGPRLKVEAIQTAVLLRKGQPRPRHLLPRIYKPRPQPEQRRRVIVRRDPTPNPPPQPRRRRVNDDDLMKRALKRLEQRSNEETDVRGDDDKPPGVESGSDIGTTDDPRLARAGSMYGLEIRRAIDRQKLPDLFSAQLASYKSRIQIAIQISREGRLVKADVTQTSGNNRFDSALLACIRRAAPFPRPPDSVWKLVKNGIEISW